MTDPGLPPVSYRYIQRWKAVGRVVFSTLLRLEIHGAERLPQKGPYIVAANHPTYLEPLLVGYAVPALVRAMAWDAIFRVPILGPLAASSGAFPVPPDDPRGAIRAQRTAHAVLDAGEILMIFPEGRRSHPDGRMEKLQLGIGRLAARAACPIYCASVLGSWTVWPRGRGFRPGRVQIVFHPPLRFDPEEARLRMRDRDYHREITDAVGAKIGNLVEEVRRERKARRDRFWLPPDLASRLGD